MLVKRYICLICIALLATVARGSSSIHCCFIIGPRREKTCLREFANNKGADQPALPRSLISTFVIRLLKSTIHRLAMSEISMFWLAYVADQVGLNLTLSETPKLGFLTSWPNYVYVCRVWEFFIVDLCISLCLRAPKKIDSSVGLPSLNKVVTYLLTYMEFCQLMSTTISKIMTETDVLVFLSMPQNGVG